MKTSLERRLIAVRGMLVINPFKLFEEVLVTPPKEICVSTTSAEAPNLIVTDVTLSVLHEIFV